MAKVTLRQLFKQFGDTPVVKGVDLVIEDGEFFSLLGPSGCGKTTLLRMIAGFVFPTSGSVHFDDQDVTQMPPNKRNTGMVFQNYALFPHMTVFENVAFGLRTRQIPKSEIAHRVAAALGRVGLSGLEQRPTPQLSGGQQQRVALARAIVIEPALLLLDEPLSNLDARLRDETRDQIRIVQKQLGITTIYVTHDQEEALAVSDRIAVLSDGVCQQVDTPDTIYRRPANRFVATFMGKMNLLEGHLSHKDDQAVFTHSSGLTIPVSGSLSALDGPIWLAVRPQAIRLKTISEDQSISSVIIDRQFKGAAIEFRLNAGSFELQASFSSDDPVAALQPGDTVWLSVPDGQPVLLRD